MIHASADGVAERELAVLIDLASGAERVVVVDSLDAKPRGVCGSREVAEALTEAERDVRLAAAPSGAGEDADSLCEYFGDDSKGAATAWLEAAQPYARVLIDEIPEETSGKDLDLALGAIGARLARYGPFERDLAVVAISKRFGVRRQDVMRALGAAAKAHRREVPVVSRSGFRQFCREISGNSVVFGGRAGAGRWIPDGGSVEDDEAAVVEDSVEDGLGEVVVVEDAAPLGQGLVGGEDDRLALEVALVDDVVEDIGGVVAEREVADLVDDEDTGSDVALEDLLKVAAVGGDAELLDERGSCCEQRFCAVEDGLVGDGNREVGFAPPGPSLQDQVLAARREFGREVAAHQHLAKAGLVGEVELFDGLQEGKVRLARAPRDPSLGAMGHLFADEHG